MTGYEEEEAFLCPSLAVDIGARDSDRWPPLLVPIENCCDRMALVIADETLSSTPRLSEVSNDVIHISNNCLCTILIKSVARVLAPMRVVHDSM